MKKNVLSKTIYLCQNKGLVGTEWHFFKRDFWRSQSFQKSLFICFPVFAGGGSVYVYIYIFMMLHWQNVMKIAREAADTVIGAIMTISHIRQRNILMEHAIIATVLPAANKVSIITNIRIPKAVHHWLLFDWSKVVVRSVYRDDITKSPLLAWYLHHLI